MDEGPLVPVVDGGKQFAVVVDPGDEVSARVGHDQPDLRLRAREALVDGVPEVLEPLAGQA